MSAANPVICPKCGYTRTATETVPAWQCPSCGVAYNKVALPKAPTQPVKLDRREKSATLGWGNTTSSGGAYLGLLGVGIFVPGSQVWLGVLPCLACASFYYWVSAYNRKRAIEDVPTSKIVNAAQGYVELCGTVVCVSDKVLKGPLTHETCVWYSYGIDERRGKDTVTIEHGMEGVPFLIRDDTGECLVNPRDAELLCEMCEKWDSGNMHYNEWSIRVGDPIYAIGRFSTRTAVPAADPEIEVNAVLRTWLADPKGFFSRFDADRNGKIAAPELARAREAARGEVSQKRADRANGLNTLVAPGDGRPFIIMNMAEGGVEGRFRELTVVHLVIFFIALGFLTYNLL